MPICGSELRLADCNGLVGQLQAYLATWKNRKFSYGGKAQLIEWVLIGKLLYWFNSLEL